MTLRQSEKVPEADQPEVMDVGTAETQNGVAGNKEEASHSGELPSPSQQPSDDLASKQESVTGSAATSVAEPTASESAPAADLVPASESTTVLGASAAYAAEVPAEVADVPVDIAAEVPSEVADVPAEVADVPVDVAAEAPPVEPMPSSSSAGAEMPPPESANVAASEQTTVDAAPESEAALLEQTSKPSRSPLLLALSGSFAENQDPKNYLWQRRSDQELLSELDNLLQDFDRFSRECGELFHSCLSQEPGHPTEFSAEEVHIVTQRLIDQFGVRSESVLERIGIVYHALDAVAGGSKGVGEMEFRGYVASILTQVRRELDDRPVSASRKDELSSPGEQQEAATSSSQSVREETSTTKPAT